jgi:O-antigen/teichoic acid export membrane protein
MKAQRRANSTDAPAADARRLFRGSIWSVIAAMGARASSLIAIILTAHYLDTSAFGMLGLIQTTVFMSGVFAGTGTGIAAMKLVAEYREVNKSAAAEVIVSSLSMTAVMAAAFGSALYILSPWIATTLLEQPNIIRPLQVGALLLPLTALNMTQNGVLAGFEVFRLLAAANLLAGLIALPVLLLAAVTGELVVVVGGLTLAMLLNCVIFHLAILRAARQRGIDLSFSPSALRIRPALWKLALPAVLFSMLTAPTDWACFAILATTEDGFAKLGVFNAANQWFNVCRFVAQNLSIPLIPILAHVGIQQGEGSANRIRKVIRQGLKINLLVVIPVISLGMLISPWIMQLYGPEYRSHWPTLLLLLACAGVFTVQMPVLRALHATGRIWTTFALNLLWSFSYVVATLWLVGDGSRGLATARLLSYTLYAAATLATGFFVLTTDKPSSDAEPMRSLPAAA